MIQKLLIGQFGQLKEKEIRLNPFINVLYGKNESGKTTFSRFLKAMLYGFAPSRKTDVAENEKARYTPWNNEPMFGTMEMQLDAGTDILVERAFKDSIGKSGAKVSDAVTGEELLSLEPNPGTVCYGVSLSAFEKTAFIGQNDYKIEKDEEITNRLSNLMSTMEEEVSAGLAKKKLDALRKYYFTSHGGGIINEMKKELDRLREELAAAKEDRTAYERLAVQREHLQKQLEDVQSSLERLRLQKQEEAAQEAKKEYRLILEVDEEIVRQNRRLKEINGIISNENGSADQEFIAIVRDGLAKSASHRHLAQEQKERLQKYVSEEQQLQERIQEFGQRTGTAVEEDKRYRQVEQEIAQLNQKIEILTRQEKEKKALKIGLASDKNEIFDIYERFSVGQLHETANKCKQEEEALESIRGPKTAILMFAFSAICSVSAAGLYFYMHRTLPASIMLGLCAVGIVAGIAALIWHHQNIARRKRALNRLLSEYCVGSSRQLREMVEQYTIYNQKRADQQKKVEQLSYQIELSDSAQLGEEKKEKDLYIANLLQSMGCVTPEQLEQKCERLRGLYRQKEAVGVAVVQIREDFNQCMEQAETALQETLQYVRRIFPNLAGMEDLERMIQKVEDLLQEVQRLSFSVEGLKEKKRHILKERTVEELERIARTVEGVEPLPPEEEAALDRNITIVSEEYLQLTKQHGQLISQCESYAVKGAAVADIEERISQKEEELVAAQLRHSAATAAVLIIDEAFTQIQRTFAPKLNQLAGRYLSKITNGKYRTLLIDKDYDIHIGDQNGRTFEIGYFSAGTIDQIYLSVRLALLEMLEGTKEKMPLILDDAFSQFDDERLISALRSIAEIGKERQIILLTCQKREGAILNKLCGVVEQPL